jgi:hypothetical protein
MVGEHSDTEYYALPTLNQGVGSCLLCPEGFSTPVSTGDSHYHPSALCIFSFIRRLSDRRTRSEGLHTRRARVAKRSGWCLHAAGRSAPSALRAASRRGARLASSTGPLTPAPPPPAAAAAGAQLALLPLAVGCWRLVAGVGAIRAAATVATAMQ